MSIILQQVTYVHPDKEALFRNVSFSVNKGQRVALIGNNGSGKSTLLRIIAGKLHPSDGDVICSSTPYYVPQHFGQYNDQTVAGALQINDKLRAFHAILNGSTSEDDYAMLDEDWSIEERCLTALSFWELDHLQLDQPMNTLSGGEKTKVFLTGIQIHEPSIVLMDEPTNHLDVWTREKLYAYVESTRVTLLIVSHDMTLLNIVPSIYELNKDGVTAYGGNYEFYKEQKEWMVNAMQESLNEKEKELRQAKKIAREIAERRQRESSKGKKRNEKKGLPRIVMRQLGNNAENSTAKLKEIHSGKMESLKDHIKQIQNSLPDNRLMKLDLHSSPLHTGKILLTAKEIDFRYGTDKLWPTPLSFQIRSGDRLAIEGKNGSGKTTLLKIITGELAPQSGEVIRADFNYVYVDQEYSIIQNSLTLLEQLEQFNSSNLRDHELKTLLNRFLFPHTVWDKKCKSLSGGEKMRLVLCCLLVSNNTPDMILLDEPSNNLDIQSNHMLTSVIREYKGTVIAISHDLHFLSEINITKSFIIT
ncbi:MAG: ATP-binding cassette domain-containing protein [Tannerellaceae bacterium]|jgi:ATPase subunit of ABC transporter with duplicated ATPase domains|nr:ATP-binding cassette domain-containing protein [Tannerellaceae bacterium]